MAITVKHKFVSAIPDAGDTTIVQPSNWNDDHQLVGTVPVANGGTGASTLTGYVKGTGTTAMTAATTIPNTDITGLGTASTKDAGVANGVATLDSSGTVPLSQIPALGDLNYQGTWNATTNSPTLTSSVGTKGFYYVVSVAGTTNLNGITDWQIGDWAVFNGSVWQKIDNTDAVTSVNGYTGTVVLTQTDISGTVPTSRTITAGTGLTGGGDLSANRTLAIATTGVSATTYGSASSVPVIAVNTQGQITSATNTSIAIANTAVSGLGTMSTQNANAVAVTGGTINGTTIGATTASTGLFTYISTSSSTSVTPTLSFNGSNSPYAAGATIAGSYLQHLLQNKSGTAGASTNYVLSNDLGTDSTYYGEFGMNSSVYSSGTPADFFSINSGIYFSGHDGDLSIGSGNGFKTYLAWGTTGDKAHVINASGAIGLNTNITGTTNFGTSGQVLTSGGSGATPTWTTPTTGTVTSVTGTSPVVSSGGTTPAISIPAATTSVSGYLTSTDWNTFNGKQATLVSGTNIKTVGGVSLLGAGDVGVIGGTYGGTGVNNGANTITLAGNLTHAGAFTQSFTATANTAVTLPAGATASANNLLSSATAVGIVTGTPSSLNFLRGDGTWATPAGAGTVTSVGQTFTGGLISVAGSPVTTTGTLALTVAGTSGGIPYFSSGTTWATSAALAANALMVGGGAGVAPSTITTGTGVNTALGVNTGTAGAFVVNGGVLGTPSSGTVTNLTGTASININGTVGATTASTGAFTTLSATGAVTLSPANLAVAISPSGTGTVTISPVGALTINPTAASTINNTSIGATTASTGRFTTVTSTIATGTAPFTVTSTTQVANLNAATAGASTNLSGGALGSIPYQSATATTLFLAVITTIVA